MDSVMLKLFLGLVLLGQFYYAQTAAPTISWNRAQQQPAAWYGSPEAVRIADNLLLYQRDNGGWDKNIDMAAPLDEAARNKLITEKSTGDTTIDNSATWSQMRYLARVYTATQLPRFRQAFDRALGYVFAAQYPNGGWPQYFPLRRGYYSHITYNDDAMVGVLETLRFIATGHPDYRFVSQEHRDRARNAIQKGTQVILRSQVNVDGKLTVWCAQHDVETLKPAKARTYEHPSLSGHESAGIVRFLMGIERPPAEVVQSIESAVEWLRQNQLKGIALKRIPAPGTEKGYDTVVETVPDAPPLWARFYEIGSNRPIFSGRDGIIRYSLNEIEYERRNNYRWFVDTPARLLERDYPAWKKRLLER